MLVATYCCNVFCVCQTLIKLRVGVFFVFVCLFLLSSSKGIRLGYLLEDSQQNCALHERKLATAVHHRLSPSQKAILFAAWHRYRATPSYGQNVRIQALCEELMPGFSPNRKAIERWRAKWTANGGEFTMDEEQRGQTNPRALSEDGMADLKEKMLEQNCRHVASSMMFEGKHGDMVNICANTVMKWAKDAGLVFASTSRTICVFACAFVNLCCANRSSGCSVCSSQMSKGGRSNCRRTKRTT